jgi:hypothetical protein
VRRRSRLRLEVVRRGVLEEEPAPELLVVLLVGLEEQQRPHSFCEFRHFGSVLDVRAGRAGPNFWAECWERTVRSKPETERAVEGLSIGLEGLLDRLGKL